MADASATKTCKRFGCGLRYTESANAEDACKHHSSPPSFRDGTKEWPCCKKSAWDFDTFASFTPCSVGRHSSEVAAPAAAPSTHAPVLVTAPPPAEAAAQPAVCPRCAQGFLCSDHPNAKSSAPVAAKVVPPVEVDPDATQTCKRYCCGLKFTERANADEACRHHPSGPSFRDGVREWPCCSKRAPDFESLLNIPPCATGRHSAK